MNKIFKLIELIRIAIAKDFRYITIDANGTAFGSNIIPKTSKKVWFFPGVNSYEPLGEFKLTCDFKYAFLDLELLQSKGIH